MARSPLTLAASVTAALPGSVVVGSGPLTEGAAGRFDSAVVRLDDGRDVVVRTPADEGSAGDLAAESRALHALTSGVRALLPFRAPEVLGETGSGSARVLVVDLLDGYRVEPAHLPKGAGAAPAIGGALAAVHDLPPSVVRTDGLPVRTPAQVRDEVVRLVDRAQATRKVPEVLIERWRHALDSDALWRFESAVVLGGASSASVLLTETGVEGDDLRITVSGLLDWGGLSVGDPAIDLRWLASAPLAADDVFAGYVEAADRAPDELLRERARLYAELEFARWLVHGDDEGREDVVTDAVALLEALADGVRGEQIVPDPGIDVDVALALAARVPETGAAAVDTSMQTDAYDPEMVSLFLAAERDREERAAASPDFGLDGLQDAPGETQPIDLTGWSAERENARNAADEVEPAGSPDPTEEPETATHPDDEADLEQEAERASRAALRRWSTGGTA